MSLSVRKQPIGVSIKNGSFFTGVKHDSFHFVFYFYIWVFLERMGLFDVSKLRRTLLSHPQDVVLVSLATGDFVICFSFLRWKYFTQSYVHSWHVRLEVRKFVDCYVTKLVITSEITKKLRKAFVKSFMKSSVKMERDPMWNHCSNDIKILDLTSLLRI